MNNRKASLFHAAEFICSVSLQDFAPSNVWINRPLSMQPTSLLGVVERRLNQRPPLLTIEAVFLSTISLDRTYSRLRVNESRAVFLPLSPLPIITAWLRFAQPEILQLENLVPLHAPPETAVAVDRTRANLARSGQQRIRLMKYIYDLPQTCIVPPSWSSSD